ncbi:putative halogenase [Hysterangium stoloniferum]|nr:putative halogenase [Hysterangium stoloniferum]
MQPQATQILIIGGGPSGSYTASVLAREGFQVTLLEADKFPRYHIGESMLPSMRFFLSFIGALDKVIAHGFCEKPGAAIKFSQFKREGYTDFVMLDADNGAWNVVRSELDEILLRHASSVGATVFEETKVTSILFEDDDHAGRPIAVTYKRTGGGVTNDCGTIRFDYLVDASGRTGIMSQRYLRNRKFNKSLDNLAVWGYWTGCSQYAPGTTKQNAPWFEVLQDESGWAWYIPLHDGTVSIGIVRNQQTVIASKRKFQEESGDGSLRAHYLHELNKIPGILKLMTSHAELVEVGKDGGPGVRQASDFSYSAGSYAGPYFRIVGDASAFIDPFFSSGVHLGFSSGLSAAATIASSIRGETSESECAHFHDVKVGVSYTRFLVVVLAAYKQMHALHEAVLFDLDEDNYDRAFELIRPVIQGSADTGKQLSENEVQHTMDFLQNVFAPTDSAIDAAVMARVSPEFFSGLPGQVTKAGIDPTDEDAVHTVEKINAQKAISNFYKPGKDFATESINGWTVNVTRGVLGLYRPRVTRQTLLMLYVPRLLICNSPNTIGVMYSTP